MPLKSRFTNKYFNEPYWGKPLKSQFTNKYFNGPNRTEQNGLLTWHPTQPVAHLWFDYPKVLPQNFMKK